MVKALILVDFENEWLLKDSDYYVGDVSETIIKTNKLIDLCRDNNYKIIFIRHVEEDSNNAFADNSERTKIISSLHKNESDILITKHRISSFFKTNLDEELESVKEIVICGILTNLCVRSLIQDAYDRDYNIKVIKDCCVAFDEVTQEFTFKDLKSTRDEINFMNLEEFVK
ncbi:cysteine hydrolase [archaeon]|nr:cysteine hydrolase [archaeon]MBL7057668.1 cysteine hydrolase [Candidatus Woesearchaeota archaeon]